MNEEYIKNLTKAYIWSYNTAMEEYNNSSLATQVAMGIVLAVNVTEPKKEAFVINPLDMLFSHIMNNVQEQEGKESDRAENESD